MTLQDIFDQLSAGEFSQLGLGGGEVGSVPEAQHLPMARNVQLGLTSLYKRFQIRQQTLVLDWVPGQEEYTVDALDFLKIEKVSTAAGFELPLNLASHPDSLSTPAMNLIEVPRHIALQEPGLDDRLKTDRFKVLYRANHPAVTQFQSPDDVEIELPPLYLQALLLFVASRVHTPTGMTGTFSAGNNYFARYEAECKALKNEGVEIDQVDQTNRRQAKGFP